MLGKKIEPSSTSSIQHLTQQWLELRQVVLVHYSELCTTKDPEPNRLQKFCQHLMDYVSMGHFKMYEKFAEHHETNQTYSTGLNKTLLSNITINTETVLDFNDKYTEPKNLDALSVDLSQIGEVLAHRMDWEDALITGAAPRYSKDH